MCDSVRNTDNDIPSSSESYRTRETMTHCQCDPSTTMNSHEMTTCWRLCLYLLMWDDTEATEKG
jgi:hypothetical protein